MPQYKVKQARLILGCAVGLSVLAFVFQLIGAVGPGWMVMNINDQVNVHIGIWFNRICGGETCRTMSWAEYQDRENAAPTPTPSENAKYSQLGGLGPSAWKAFQVVLTLGLFFVLLPLIDLSLALRRVGTRPTGLTLTASLMLAVSVICVFIPVGMVSNGIMKVQQLLSALQSTSSISDSSDYFEAPWALILSAVGGLLAFAASILSFFAFHKMFTKTDSNVNRDQNLSTSFPPRMEIVNEPGHLTVDIGQNPYPVPQGQIYAYDQTQPVDKQTE